MPASKAERFISALHRLEDASDLDTIAALYDDRAEVSNTTDAEPHVGRDGARTFWNKYRDAFERVHSEFRNILESESAALLEWRSDGRTAAGQDVSYDGVSVLEFSGDRIVRFRAYFDPHALTSGSAKRETARQLTRTRTGGESDATLPEQRA